MGKRPIVLAVVNDVHAGSTVAVCPPEIRLDDGGYYKASKAQNWMWECWGDYWLKVKEARAKYHADLYQLFNGDLIDGDHHNTSQILSRNPNAQAAVWTALAKTPLDLGPDKMFFVRGTEVHVGQSASGEERIADGLRRDKRPVVSDPETGTASWWHVRPEIHGLRIDATHHGRAGQREHTRAGAIALYAHDILLSHIKAGDPYPHLCLRAHYHRLADSYDACPTRVITNGAWQLSTGYVKKIAADTLADIAGLIVVIHPDGRYDVEKVQYKPSRGPVWRPE